MRQRRSPSTWGPVDLGQIDLLVQEGFYSNRTDLIRTAIRNQLAQHAEAVRSSAARRTLVLGVQHYYSQIRLEMTEALRLTLAGQPGQATAELGHPRNRWRRHSGPGWGITVEEALRMYTLGSARCVFEEDTKGSITPGKFADLVVLGRSARRRTEGTARTPG